MQTSYPFLQNDGSFVSSLTARGVKNLQFRVGLTTSHQPADSIVLSLLRNFSLLTVHEPVLPRAGESRDAEEGTKGYKTTDGQNPGHAFSFSLSASLESLMSDRFLQILRLRLKYNIGWAGAESLISCAGQMQISADELFFDDSTVGSRGSISVYPPELCRNYFGQKRKNAN